MAICIYIYSRTRSDLEFDGNLGFDTRNEDAKVWLKSCTRRWSSGGHALNPKRLKPETEVADAVVPKKEVPLCSHVDTRNTDDAHRCLFSQI